MVRYFATATLLTAVLFVPLVSNASPYLYSLSTDYSGIGGLPSGSTVSWQFVVPSILTTPTTITSFLSASLGPGLSGCGGVLDAQLPLIAQSPYTSLVITDFTGSCNGGFTGAGANFYGSLGSKGVDNAFARSTGTIIGTLTISSVPEPTMLSLLGTALLGAFAARLRRSNPS
jgi:PEP-CTERM motif-containing protein